MSRVGLLLQVACAQPGSGPSSSSGEVAVPGARKPSVGEGTESRRPPPLQLLHCPPFFPTTDTTWCQMSNELYQHYTMSHWGKRWWKLWSGTVTEVRI